MIQVVYGDPTAGKISKIPGRNTSEFKFSATEAFVEFIVGVVQFIDSPLMGLSPIKSQFGSQNVAGEGNWEADEEITTTIKAKDLHAASPWDGKKVIKVFVKSADGEWSE